jgi:hypothetical protein
MEQRFLHLANY